MEGSIESPANADAPCFDCGGCFMSWTLAACPERQLLVGAATGRPEGRPSYYGLLIGA